MTSSIEDSKDPIKNTKKLFSQKQVDISHLGLLICEYKLNTLKNIEHDRIFKVNMVSLMIGYLTYLRSSIERTDIDELFFL